MLSLPSLSRRRSSFRSRKPTASRSHGDHGNAAVTSGYSRGFVGNVVFGIVKRLAWMTGKTSIMEVYCFTANGNCSVFQLHRGEPTGLLGRKLSYEFHLRGKGIKR